MPRSTKSAAAKSAATLDDVMAGIGTLAAATKSLNERLSKLESAPTEQAIKPIKEGKAKKAAPVFVPTKQSEGRIEMRSWMGKEVTDKDGKVKYAASVMVTMHLLNLRGVASDRGITLANLEAAEVFGPVVARLYTTVIEASK